MDTAILPSPAIATAAQRLASANLRANLAAFASAPPDWSDRLPEILPDLEWIFARDGYLTARSSDAWHSGCSVPLRTGQELLKLLELKGNVGCFLQPTHAGQIRACFEKLKPAQAIIAVVPDLQSLRIILHCDDFSPQIAASRLFFVSGSDWRDQLAKLFSNHPGMPLPQQFVRTALLDDADMAVLTDQAQAVISHETSARSARLPEILACAAQRLRTGRVLVMAGSQFNLADLSNTALRSALLLETSDPAFIEFDPDHPLTASPLALAEAAAEADAIVTADLFRADLPGIVSPQTAWITWLTSGRIVAPELQATRDALLIADPAWQAPAQKAGWPTDRIQTAAWPRLAAAAPDAPPIIGVFADTRTIEVPQRVKDFSSQILLWEMIEHELSKDPLALGNDAQKYLQARMQQFNIADEGFDRNLFFERLIVPAYQQGICRLALRHGIPLMLFGYGWSDLPEFKAAAKGTIESAQELTRAVPKCRVILQLFPERQGSTQALAIPSIHPIGLNLNQFLNALRQTLAAKPNVTPATHQALNQSTIRTLIF